MKIAATLYGAVLGLLLGIGAVHAEDPVRWKSPAYLVDAFVELALRSEYSTRQSRVHKWISPVNYFIVHRAGDDGLTRRLIDAHFEHLAAITGLPIRSTESQDAANYLIVLTSEDKLEADIANYFGAGSHRQQTIARHSVCLVTLVSQHKGPIVRAVAMIPVDTARARGELASCVAEELTHAMGLPNDSPKDLPSIFSRKYYQVFLSGLDLLLLQMLYDPRVKSGMDEKTVRPILQKIASECARDNCFNDMETLAAEGGLTGLSLRSGCR